MGMENIKFTVNITLRENWYKMLVYVKSKENVENKKDNRDGDKKTLLSRQQ